MSTAKPPVPLDRPSRLEDFLQSGGVLESVMFDLDGTLIDSVPTYFRIAEAMLREVGLPPAPREAMAAMLKEGLSGFHHLIPVEMSDRREELIEACMVAGRTISARMYADSVTLVPGVKKLFRRLSESGIRIGLVTSSHAAFIEKKLLPLKEAQIDQMIQAVVLLDDTKERKPSPEPVSTCARRLGAAADRSIFVGDADVDVEAGRKAGTFTVGVLTGVDDYDTLSLNLPDLIVPSIRGLIPFFQAP